MMNLFLSAASGGEGMHWGFVCLIGIGVVFAGLICIIGLVELMTFICNKIASKVEKKAETAVAPVKNVAQAPITSNVIENRDELIAAVCAAVAEENGTDISAIRVVSFKKV